MFGQVELLRIVKRNNLGVSQARRLVNELKANGFQTLQEKTESPLTRSWFLGGRGVKLKVS
jgi:predicted transcriptional regulator